jgi:hypothetical protein
MYQKILDQLRIITYILAFQLGVLLSYIIFDL